MVLKLASPKWSKIRVTLSRRLKPKRTSNICGNRKAFADHWSEVFYWTDILPDTQPTASKHSCAELVQLIHIHCMLQFLVRLSRVAIE